MPIRTLAFAFHLSYLSGYSYSILCKDHIKAVAAKTCNEDDDKNRYFLVLTTLTSSLVWLSISTLRKSGPPTSVSLSSSARRAASVLSRVRLFIQTETAPEWSYLCQKTSALPGSESQRSLGGTSLLLERVYVPSHVHI